jgi:hypothetical protein
MTDEVRHGTSREGSAVIDIGPGVGALVVHAPQSLAGQELEISVTGSATRTTHTVVRERRVGGRRTFAALFPALPVGDYVIWSGGQPVADRVSVASGEVTQTTLPFTPAPMNPEEQPCPS